MRGLLLSIFSLAACGGGGSDAPVDAPPPDVAYDTARCLIAGHYGDLGSKTGTLLMQQPSTIVVELDAGPPRDTFLINLKEGQGVFANGLMTGIYTIAGAELSQSTCGLCVNIVADIVAGSGPTKFYFATGGMVTLTSHTPPEGTISNVTFHEVTSAGAPINGGCSASITGMAFTVPP